MLSQRNLPSRFQRTRPPLLAAPTTTERPDRTVVIVHENFVEENWGASRRAALRPPAPRCRIRSARRLLDHQHEALGMAGGGLVLPVIPAF